MAVAITADEPRPMSETLSAYEEYLLGEGLAASTIRNYSNRLKIVLTACLERGWDSAALSVDEVHWLSDRFSPNHSSQSLLRCTLQHFWRWQGVEGPVKAIRVPPQPPGRYRGLESDEASKLEQAAVEAGHPRGTAVLVGLYLGLRRDELIRLRWSDFDDELEWVTIVGKGQRTRHIPVAPVLRRELRPHRSGVGWLFPSSSGTRTYIHAGTFYAWLADLAARAGIRKTHPHGLRHTCLATLNDETGDLRTTQTFAGHATMQSTVGYTRATGSRLQAAVATLNYRLEAS